MVLEILASGVLLVIALVHGLWGLGIWVPIRNEEALAHAVVGARGVTRMPGPIPCFLVAAGLMIFVLAIWMPHTLLGSLVLWIGVIVFLLRGVLAYVPFWRRMTPEEPFATLDRRIFGPLCLALGVAFVIFAMQR